MKKTAVFMIFLLSLPVSTNLVKFNDSDLWSNNPKIHYSREISTAWWLEGYRKGPLNDNWRLAIENLEYVYKNNNNSIINDNLCSKYINDYNNTIFLIVKNINDDVKSEFLKIMNPANNVKVIFKKGLASLNELNIWEDEIYLKLFEFEKSGIIVTSLGKSENGTIKVGIKDISDEKIHQFLT